MGKFSADEYKSLSLTDYLLCKELRKRLHIEFKKLPLPPPAAFEDFYHDYCVHRLEGKGKSQTLRQYAIDWLRKAYGKTFVKYWRLYEQRIEDHAFRDKAENLAEKDKAF